MEESRRASLNKKIGSLPRVEVARTPTPLDKAPRLSEALEGPEILLKRDDLTGLALGGNKTRMFEFIVGEALEEGADAVVAGSSVHSNYCRQLTAACSKYGIETHLLLRLVRGDIDKQIQGNLLLDLLAGAQVTFITGGPAEQDEIKEQVVEELQEEGKQVYLAGSPNYDLCAIAYAEVVLELLEQAERTDLEIDYVYVSSSASTQAGLVVASNYLQAEHEVVGVSHGLWRDGEPVDEPTNIAQIANQAAGTLGLDAQISPEQVTSIGRYTGEGYQDKYGPPPPDIVEAMKMVAREEGVLLDPIYSGKAMAGLINDIREGKVDEEDTVVFLHTGGAPSLFTYGDQLNLDDGIVGTI